MIAFLREDRTEAARVVRHSTRARRLRLEVPAILGDRHLARRFAETARTWPGVVAAAADPVSGRMLLEYAPGAPLLHRLVEMPFFETRRAQERHDWHAATIEELYERLGSSPDGLSSPEAAGRLHRHGPNLGAAAVRRSRLAILAEQLDSVPMAMLLASAGASVLLRDLVECAAILVVAGLDAGIGYRIERQNEEVLTSWRKLEAGSAQVVRDGAMRTVSATELVPGDLLLVRAGDILPADARILDAHRLAADEAPLTGESEPQAKSAEPVAADAPLGERRSMLFAGTTVASGHGRALVVATGAATELARIRSLVEEAEAPQPPLARRMDRLGRRVAAVSLGAAGLATAASILHGRPLRETLQAAVALGVAALPEGLPLVATSALVRSMERLGNHGMVVRRVAASEALGGVTVICTDKTGTLTANEMRLEWLRIGGRKLAASELVARRDRLFEDPVTTALAAGLLNSDVDVLASDGSGLAIAGSSTERALVDAAHRAGLDGAELRRSFPRLHLEERREGIHYVVSVHRAADGSRVAFLKGAPEQVLQLCDADVNGPLDRRALLAANDELAASGLRVLALAFRRPEAERFTFLGLAGLRDPLRPGAAETIERARRAGIRTLILTGDQLHTAAAVARELRMDGETLLANELLGATDLDERLERVAVLARVAPEDKVAIVRALRERGEVVAMAGDGINDAPALKAADVGIAVGASATDLARQVADIVMSGEDLRSIVAAVGEGRIVQDNLRRALRFLFATNLSETALVLGAALVGARTPLRPLQLLWINLLTDTLPGLALAFEPGEPDVLDRPPASRELFSSADLRRVVQDALLLTSVGAVGFALGGPSLAFASLTAAQITYAVTCRAPQRLHGVERLAADRRFAALIGGGALLQFLALTAPPLRALLQVTAPVPTVAAGFAAGLALPQLARMRPSNGRVVRYGPGARRKA